MTDTDKIQDRLRMYGQHDGHSTDTHVKMCTAIHEAADLIEQLEADIEAMNMGWRKIPKHVQDAIRDKVLEEAAKELELHSIVVNGVEADLAVLTQAIRALKQENQDDQ